MINLTTLPVILMDLFSWSTLIDIPVGSHFGYPTFSIDSSATSHTSKWKKRNSSKKVYVIRAWRWKLTGTFHCRFLLALAWSYRFISIYVQTFYFQIQNNLFQKPFLKNQFIEQHRTSFIYWHTYRSKPFKMDVYTTLTDCFIVSVCSSR